MMYDDIELKGFSRPDMIRYVLQHCVPVPTEKMHLLVKMRAWCRERVGVDRPGSLLMEAMEGWLDYFDGNWGDFPNDLDTDQYLFWFARTDDRTLFTLTWL